ncbi:lipoprotein N-acyltransferase Lnb domain-containing protein [Flavobacterium agrisoli]|uniref:DUF4105 domain-containing protein n=1 Tax=Flavobacterium agrisoli TaxID=2793066 RepID=A0A934PPI4_9FLAO|nr:DUF4105 domain-containing protein [Flavobacterium agrisoli]MBK0370733.1 DUF4105 domain-containing protein [Flavobacterium agrisoli]
MKALQKLLYLVGLWSLLFAKGYSQNTPLSTQAKVSVLTCGTGNESYSLFGHTAIRVKDSVQGLDVVYNYGAFDFNTPNFVAKFAKGDLQYFVVAHSYADFIYNYTAEKRSVYEQELQIETPAKQLIFNNLNKTLFSEERYYTYKFIDKNCTTMVVDILNQSLGSDYITKKGDTTQTYRSVLYPYFDGHFYEQLGTSIIFGTKVDQKATHIFLPFELKNSLAKTKYQQHPLARKSSTLLYFEKEKASSWWNNWYTYVLFLGLVLVLNKKSLNYTFLTILGILGLFFITMGFYSFHHELANNYNALLFSPLLVLLVFFAVIQNKKRVYQLAVFHLILLVAYTIYIANKAHFLIVLPLCITTFLILLRIAWHNKKIPIIM